MGDAVEKSLGFGFVFGYAALVVLVVAQGGLGVGQRTVHEVALTGAVDPRRAASWYMTAMLKRVAPAWWRLPVCSKY